jgi:hypothetical protein
MGPGQYDSARVAFDSLGFAHDLSVAPRLALGEIEVVPAKRWRMRARSRPRSRRRTFRASRSPGSGFPNGDWIYGAASTRASSEYRAGLAASGDYRLLAATARLAAARHEWRDAIAAAKGDRHFLTGDARRVERRVRRDRRQREVRQYARALDVAVLKQPGAYRAAVSSCSTIVTTSPACIARCSSSCARVATSTGTTVGVGAPPQGRDVGRRRR